MQFSQPPSLLTLLFTILSTSHFSDARPSPDPALKHLLETRYHYLSERDCANPCGWTGQVCCASGQTCSTNSAGQAVCIVGSAAKADVANGNWQYYTTTYVKNELTTVTSTYSSFFGSQNSAAAAGPAVSAISCDSSLGESPCGTLCCATGQYCAYSGQCAASNGNGAESSSSLFEQNNPAVTATTNVAPLRPTSNVATTATSIGSATTTVAFMTPSPTGTAAAASGTAAGVASTTTNNGLSGGAIAGIVIGVLLAILFLLLLCIFCCLRGLVDSVLGFFGLRNNRRRRERVTEEHVSRHHGRTWYGGKSTVDKPKKRGGGLGELLGVGGALAALAVFLGVKRRRDDKKAKTEHSGSSYTYSDTYSSESSESSISIAQRTRDTRRSSGRR